MREKPSFVLSLTTEAASVRALPVLPDPVREWVGPTPVTREMRACGDAGQQAGGAASCQVKAFGKTAILCNRT